METIKSIIKKIDQYISLRATGIALLGVFILLILIEYIWDDSVGNLMNISVLIVLAIILAFLIAAVILNRYLGRYLRARRISLSGLRERFTEWQTGQSETIRTVSRAVLALLLIFPIILLTLIAVETFWEGSVSYHINLDILVISTIAAEMIAIVAVMIMLYKYRPGPAGPKRRRPAPRTLPPEIRAERAAAGLSTPAAAVAPAETMAGHGKRGWAGRVARVALGPLFVIIMLLLVFQSSFNITFLEGTQTGLAITAVICGVLVFWLNRNKLKSTMEEATKEERKEAERNDKFSTQFPRVNRIFVIRWFIRWMYREGWKYSAALIVIIISGIVLRIWDLGNLNVLVEEQFHYVPAINLIQEGTPKMFFTSAEYFGYVEYNRTYLYTLITAGIFKIFGVSEFNLRIFSVFLSVTTGIIIYLFSKKVMNKQFALVSTGLFMFSSWAIWYSRWARHYVFDGFLLMLFIWIAFLVIFKNRNKYLFLIPLILMPWVEIGNLVYLATVGALALVILRPKELFRFIKDKRIIIIILVTIANLFIYNHFGQNNYITPTLDNIPTESEYPFIGLLVNFFSNLFPLKFDGYFLKLMWDYYPSLVILASISFLIILIYAKKRRFLILLSFPLMLLLLCFYDPGKTWGWSQYWTWEPRHFSFLIPLFLLFSSVGFFYILKSNYFIFKIAFLVIIFVAIFSIQPYKLNYGDNIAGTPYQVLASSEFYLNIKSPTSLIKTNYNEDTDLLIYDTLEVMYRAYWDKEPDLRVGWDRDDNGTIEESNVTNCIPDDPTILEEYIRENLALNKRVWLIESAYNDINHNSRVRKGEIRRFLETKGDSCIVYSESYTEVYLFTSECFQ